MKAGANFQQRSDAAVDFSVTSGGLGDAGKDLEQRTLPRSVASLNGTRIVGGDAH